MTGAVKERDLTKAERARLEAERNELNNSFGGSAWYDGLLQRRISFIDETLASGRTS
jgi:hypothetical protein